MVASLSFFREVPHQRENEMIWNVAKILIKLSWRITFAETFG